MLWEGMGWGCDAKSVELVRTEESAIVVFLALARSLARSLFFFLLTFLLLPCFVFVFVVKCVFSGRP